MARHAKQVLSKLSEFFPGDQFEVDVSFDPEVPDHAGNFGVTLVTKRSADELSQALPGFEDWYVNNDDAFESVEFWIRHV